MKGKINYKEYVKSLKWSYRREDIIRKIKKCQRCNLKVGLEVHHGNYKQLGFESYKHLFILCKYCHKEFHKKYGVKEDLMEEIYNYIKGDFIPRKPTRKLQRKKNKNRFKIATKNDELYWKKRVNEKFNLL